MKIESVERSWRNRLTAAVAVAVLLSVASTPAAGQTELRWKLKEGQAFKVDFQQQIDSETRVNKVPIKMSLTMGMEMQWRVVQVDSQGLVKISQSFTRMTMTLQSSKQTVMFDSASERHAENARSIAESIGPLIGAEFFVSMNDRGEVVNVQLSDKAQRAVAAAGENSRVKELFSKEGVAKMLKQSAGALPKAAVDKGDQWKGEQTFVSSLGDVKQTNEYLYRGPAVRNGASLAQIDVRSELDVTPKKSNDPKTPTTRLKRQETTGSQWFDTAKGRLVESTTTQKLVSERPFANTIIEVTTTSSLSMKISEKE